MSADIKSMSLEELRSFFISLSQPPYRANQLFDWLSKGVKSFDEMTNLSKALRQTLETKAFLLPPEIVKTLKSKDGTVKYLMRFSDRNSVECVLMPYRHGNSLCISTQAGCHMGCSFCASTLSGLARNLTPAEMLDQVIFSSAAYGSPVNSIVLMGIGEPLDNFDNVLKFVEIINHPSGINLGQRHITISTCGLADKIKELADRKLQITLSVSLHAPEDRLRSSLMPVNHRYNIASLMDACRYYIKKTSRRISFEYILIEGTNDTPECVNRLTELLSGMLCHINIIPLNAACRKGFTSAAPAAVQRFSEALKKRGLNVTIRRHLGDDINASCGQLRLLDTADETRNFHEVLQ